MLLLLSHELLYSVVQEFHSSIPKRKLCIWHLSRDSHCSTLLTSCLHAVLDHCARPVSMDYCYCGISCFVFGVLKWL